MEAATFKQTAPGTYPYLFEVNVRLVGPYGYQSGEQVEQRAYRLPSGEEVLCRVTRLTPARQASQNINISVPSGKYLLTRTLQARGRVCVELSQHG